MDIRSERVAQHLARDRGFEGAVDNGRTLKSPLFSFGRRSHWLCSRMHAWLSGEGSTPVPLAPTAIREPRFLGRRQSRKCPNKFGLFENFCRTRDCRIGGQSIWRGHFSRRASYCIGLVRFRKVKGESHNSCANGFESLLEERENAEMESGADLRKKA